MKLDNGKYIIKIGRSFHSKIEYWMIYNDKNGKKTIKINQGYPQEIKNSEDEIFLDDDVKIIKQLSISKPIKFKKAILKIEAIDEYDNQVCFDTRSLPALNRLLRIFPSINSLLK